MPVFTKKENATLAQRIEVLDWHHANGKNQSRTAKHFNVVYPNLQIKQPLVSAWVKDEAKWREESASNRAGFQAAKRARQTLHPAVTEMLDLWVSNAMLNNILVTGEVLRQKWTTFAGLAGIPKDEHLILSNGWLACFKARNNLKEYKRHGEAASVGPDAAQRERERIQRVIKTFGVEPRNLFNADETGFFYG